MIRTGFLCGIALYSLIGFGLVGPAAALEEHKDEKDKLKACEVTLCTLVTKKAPAGGDMACHLSKTWAKDKIKAGSASGHVSWGFGDARCTVELKLPRTAVIDSLKTGDATLQFPEHVVSCEIEREREVTHVKLKLAPKVVFRDGKAITAWVNLKEVDGPTTMKGLAFTAAKLEDRLGVFHKSLIGAINHQLHDKCPKVASGK